jgi:SAM-dependent methyltransferase
MSGSTGAMNDPMLMTEWAGMVLAMARQYGVEPRDARFTEVGPGHSLGVAALILMSGASKVIAVDVAKFADPTDTTQFDATVAHALENGRLIASALVPGSQAGLEYAIVSPSGNWPLSDASCDVVYSFYSGEHIRRVKDVLDETYRVLCPGGLCMHAIDLRDHYHLEDNWLHFLYYEPWLWQAMHSRRGRWTNRLRSPQWHEAFARRFEVLQFDELRNQPFPEDFDASRLASPFRRFDRQTLEVSHLWIVVRRPPDKIST